MSITIKTSTYPKELVYKLQPEKFYEKRDETGYFKNKRNDYPNYRISMTHEGQGYELFCMVDLTDIDGILYNFEWYYGDGEDNYAPEESSYIEYLQNKLKDPSVIEKIRQYILNQELEIEIELY